MNMDHVPTYTFTTGRIEESTAHKTTVYEVVVYDDYGLPLIAPDVVPIDESFFKDMLDLYNTLTDAQVYERHVALTGFGGDDIEETITFLPSPHYADAMAIMHILFAFDDSDKDAA